MSFSNNAAITEQNENPDDECPICSRRGTHGDECDDCARAAGDSMIRDLEDDDDQMED